ncbi:MAG: type II toxin-antitoxin system VapB family antitoxin [Hamadaea sp.]|uniref:type II toxin-antitoxin system VapB family antitoxin n=1 Tax=Hamadaea sp. TaxID=2024425 RepID=UPI00182A502D|nr:type II toxin-antitoxin system VapB family antitoxin [Hamadaea sp.]NUR73614.1 type II toxin-antitoxin system VapB family antitoxin [Hamadaea sp.]NUT17653.1 type II toxin-antitoxin system VapB family antitoxin [Hamadaea sp.]
MAKVLIDVDEEALEQAAKILGTTSKKETVNTALREVSARERRLKAFHELREMGKRGDFDMLLDKENYRPRPKLPPLE